MDKDKTVAEVMDDGAQFDCNLASANAWFADASLYTGERRAWRVAKARRFLDRAQLLLSNA